MERQPPEQGPSRQCLCKGLQIPARPARGEAGGVTHLLFFCFLDLLTVCFLPGAGQAEQTASSWDGRLQPSSSSSLSLPEPSDEPHAMRLLVPALMLGLLCGALAAEESCVGHCEDGFNAQRKCQCDVLCVYYQSCCSDYTSVCKPKVTRGDMFAFPEDDYVDYSTNTTWGETTEIPDTGTDPPTTSPDPVTAATSASVTVPGSDAPVLVPTGLEELEQEQPGKEQEQPGEEQEQPGKEEEQPGEEEQQPGEEEQQPGEEEERPELCSGKPFDAFTDLKNGSLYAFRGKYVYELDEKSVRPGYPKLIRDVWGIEGPVDAAFTRINCQGKTYIFQGSQYWRFEDGALDPDYPRNISDGFQDIPDDIDAAFALPAHSYLGQERVYFFKDRHYWAYDFANQPSRQDCEVSSPSLVFDHYTFMQGESWEDLFQLLFGGSTRSRASGPRSISRDWKGVPSHLDAAMAGRIYVSSRASSWARRRKSRRQRKRYRSRRPAAHTFWDWLQDESDSSDMDPDWLPGGSRCQPIQSVYFFVADKYYRLNLRSKRVDSVRPRYPRPIAQYWLGCP